MHIRMTSKRRNAGRAAGKTVPAQGETTAPQEVPRLPHEHDESSDSQAGADASQQRVGRQAHRDVQQGLVDTDRAPVMDKAYGKVKGKHLP